jgi:hypothetical protein
MQRPPWHAAPAVLAWSLRLWWLVRCHPDSAPLQLNCTHTIWYHIAYGHPVEVVRLNNNLGWSCMPCAVSEPAGPHAGLCAGCGVAAKVQCVCMAACAWEALGICTHRYGGGPSTKPTLMSVSVSVGLSALPSCPQRPGGCVPAWHTPALAQPRGLPSRFARGGAAAEHAASAARRAAPRVAGPVHVRAGGDHSHAGPVAACRAAGRVPVGARIVTVELGRLWRRQLVGHSAAQRPAWLPPPPCSVI